MNVADSIIRDLDQISGHTELVEFLKMRIAARYWSELPIPKVAGSETFVIFEWRIDNKNISLRIDDNFVGLWRCFDPSTGKHFERKLKMDTESVWGWIVIELMIQGGYPDYEKLHT